MKKEENLQHFIYRWCHQIDYGFEKLFHTSYAVCIQYVKRNFVQKNSRIHTCTMRATLGFFQSIFFLSLLSSFCSLSCLRYIANGSFSLLSFNGRKKSHLMVTMCRIIESTNSFGTYWNYSNRKWKWLELIWYLCIYWCCVGFLGRKNEI